MSNEKHSRKDNPIGPYTQIISDEIFTDRQEFLDRWFQRILGTPRLAMMSHALIGRRRMGKTEVLLRLFNRLFWEQDEVTPVYANLEDMAKTGVAFARDYFANFLRHYFAFRHKDEHERFLDLKLGDLLDLAQQNGPSGLQRVATRFRAFLDEPIDLMRVALEGARDVSDLDQTPIVFLVDEFQRILDVDTTEAGKPDILALFKPGVEGLLCPNLITGSAVTLFTRQILGTGPLFLRFKVERFGGLEGYYGIELAERSARPYGLRVSQEVAAELAHRADGNPFYIRAVVSQAGSQGWHLDDPGILARATAVDITRGTIFSDLSDWVTQTLFRANQHGLTREVLLTMAEREGEPFTPDDAHRLAASRQVSDEDVYQSLQHLARADLIEPVDILGVTYGVVKDPILRGYLGTLVKAQRYGITQTQTERELTARYISLQGSYSDLVGLLAEAYIELLLRKFDDREVEGERFFNTRGKVKLPRFDRVVARHPFKGEGTPQVEIDVVGTAGLEEWWCVESKNWKEPVGVEETKRFLAASQVAGEVWKYPPSARWFFGRSGFTAEAEASLRREGVLFSDGEQLDTLLAAFGLRALPLLRW